MKYRFFTQYVSIAVLTLLSVTAGAVSREKEPVWQQLTEIDGRVLRIERVLNNQSLLEMAQKDDELQKQLRDLRGQLEELQHSVEVSRNQFRDAFADLDKRVQALESSKATATTMAPASTSTSTTATTSAASGANDNDAYQAAFGLLKDGKYTEATAAFTQFIASYPQSSLRGNAQYWIGEAYYTNKDYAQAIKAFQIVLDKYSDSIKVPDAMLELGYSQYELKDFKAARAVLTKLTNQYADSKAATYAQQRLAKMSAEGQ
ncbi:MAG: tol-pal system protein YbgF [Steroidobacter sp.]